MTHLFRTLYRQGLVQATLASLVAVILLLTACGTTIGSLVPNLDAVKTTVHVIVVELPVFRNTLISLGVKSDVIQAYDTTEAVLTELDTQVQALTSATTGKEVLNKVIAALSNLVNKIIPPTSQFSLAVNAALGLVQAYIALQPAPAAMSADAVHAAASSTF